MEKSAERAYMVEGQLRRRGIRDERVLEAMGRLPRELFIPLGGRDWAYADQPVSIGFGQTISQPYMAARMAELLELRGAETVLEVGAGSGYAAALLASLTHRVVALEIVPELAAVARANLAEAGFTNVEVLCGDGSLGYEPGAPYGGISVAAGAPAAPEALLRQLLPGVRLVIPVGDLDEQELLVYEKKEEGWTSRGAGGCRFVPLRGAAGWREPLRVR
jgi:protein-L-isoaspartate(D-aspartate) O-methyltransferase